MCTSYENIDFRRIVHLTSIDAENGSIAATLNHISQIIGDAPDLALNEPHSHINEKTNPSEENSTRLPSLRRQQATPTANVPLRAGSRAPWSCPVPVPSRACLPWLWCRHVSSCCPLCFGSVANLARFDITSHCHNFQSSLPVAGKCAPSKRLSREMRTLTRSELYLTGSTQKCCFFQPCAMSHVCHSKHDFAF